MSDKTTDWVSIQEAANRLGVAERTVYRRVKSGKLKSKQLDGRTVIRFDKRLTDVRQVSDKVTIARLEAELAGMVREVTRLEENRRSQGEEIDYLRQALAASLSKIPAIEATVSDPAPADPPRRWFEFWK